jgi:hypothetical protein
MPHAGGRTNRAAPGRRHHGPSHPSRLRLRTRCRVKLPSVENTLAHVEHWQRLVATPLAVKSPRATASAIACS